MTFDLKETKTTEKESFDHMLTVVGAEMAGDNIKEARNYLKSYIYELFKQQR